MSVEYLITTPEKRESFEDEADAGWTYLADVDGYTLYHNDNYVPMGFTYDYYVTKATYEASVKTLRSNLLLRALVLEDEDVKAYGQYLTELPDAMLDDLHYDSYTQDCADRRAHSCSVFQMNNAGFHAEITLDKTNLVFFSVPYDDGFTAYVNGEKADILRVDEGLMAVLCPAGASSIDFVYQAAGLSASRVVTAVAIPVWVVYVAYFVRRKRRSTGALILKRPPTPNILPKIIRRSKMCLPMRRTRRKRNTSFSATGSTAMWRWLVTSSLPSRNSSARRTGFRRITGI